MRNIILILTMILLTGCASAGLNSVCGHIQGNQVTIPYVGGKADGDVISCHVGCFGMNCPKPDYDSIAKLTASYMTTQNDKITTTGPGTITFTPATK